MLIHASVMTRQGLPLQTQPQECGRSPQVEIDGTASKMTKKKRNKEAKKARLACARELKAESCQGQV